MRDWQRALVIAAHPDDEALGCGGTMARLASQGCEVSVLFLTDGVGARTSVADSKLAERQGMGDAACDILGVRRPTYLSFPDNRLDGCELLDVVAAIERHSAELKPDVVLTHFLGDLNIDHRICAQAAVTAFRPIPGQTVKAILGFEVASSTEWAYGVAGQSFSPNLFIDISAHMRAKLDALRAYEKEMRPFPHVRSLESVEACARWRGAGVGVEAAEAFIVMRLTY